MAHDPLPKVRARAVSLALAALAAGVAPGPPAGAGAQPPEPPRIHALTGATVVASPGRILPGATVIVRDGLIEAVGIDVTTPSDATEIDLSGKWVYPGLIDAGPVLEVRGNDAPAPGGLPGARDGASETGAVHPLGRVRPERSAVDGLTPFAGEDGRRRAQRLRELGFAIVAAAPAAGVFRGEGAAVALHDDRPVREILVAARTGQHVAFERGGFGGGYPTSLMGAVATVRQTLLDASRYADWTARWERDPAGLPRPESSPAWDALAPVVRGAARVWFHVDGVEDVLLAGRLADEFALDAALYAAGPLDDRPEAVAATGRTVVVSARFPDKPAVAEDDVDDVTLAAMRRYVDAPAVPGRLRAAGVRVALTSAGLDNPGDFRRNVRRMIAAGLSEDDALAALTVVPAERLGLARAAGTIEPGRMADLVIADGPLFAEDTAIEAVFVDGVRYAIETKPRPKGDPDAVVDPRGTWSVVYDFGGRSIVREWTLAGSPGAWTGTAETQQGTVAFESVELRGNLLTVRQPGGGRGPTVEIVVVIAGDTFEGSTEFGARSVEVRGTRTAAPKEDRR